LHVLLLPLLLLLLFLGQLFHSAAASVRKSSICFQLSSSKTFFGIIRKKKEKRILKITRKIINKTASNLGGR
jgi:hypothetical protein